ncbi:carbamoyltransferase HypF [Blastopirellula sp. JC732]|uniref:Carbamoyltransferase n=1 Tax=Blastopirellula sediminis TaxID=2894196 RepID=A0A9X1MN03_9BACT|nr:carbamoyltransferase HypF [Blastopirellula sediminis]MCC9608341.1 carbamoyltransferase HypF [Blastopirellula sediminis]MCC9628882.1 carbamoyltransferase HypF [Blastopirellula sediminis]
MSAITDNAKVETAAQVALRISLAGRLQGIGVRPAIYRLAMELGVGGQVRNCPHGVELDVAGSQAQVAEFRRRLRSCLPGEANVTRESYADAPLARFSEFSILQDDSSAAIVTSVPVDVAVCADCLAEVRRPGDRRYRYLFNSCVKCGPRYSIIRRMPFERDSTAMAEFPLCDECRQEYSDVEDRRFHAQTISCPKCGPRIWSVSQAGEIERDQEAALEAAAAALLGGEIVALKGLGGYQLLVDATSDPAVERLRQRKGRASKPLAVMVRTEADAARMAVMNSVERHALTSSANPIVLLVAKRGATVARSVFPGLNTIGLFLPTTPLHDLLLERVGRPLVCTSGNREGEPLAYSIEEAESQLAEICDLWIHHNREIVRPIDDSVVRVFQEQQVTLRLARGLAPLRLEVSSDESAVALGGQMKSAVAFCHGGSGVLGPHIGDLSNLATQERYRQQFADLQSLYRFSAAHGVCDQHPGYFTTQETADRFGEIDSVQHHYAHVLAAMLEHGLLDQPIMGVAWDGTGYGADGTVWGGEFLVAQGKSFERFAHLRPFALAGGEASIREPWRIAAALLGEADAHDHVHYLETLEGKRLPVEMIRQILGNAQFSPVTTSAGRLLDGVASLILRRERCEYEGELPMMLEAIADRREAGSYELAICDGKVLQLDWRPLVRQVLEDLRAEVPPQRIAMRVHRGLAAAIVAIGRRRPQLPLLLTGGVFQNRILCELVADMAKNEKLAVYLPGAIPPGDGGLAAGQLVSAIGR